MIHGIGTDIVQVARIAASSERLGERFAEKILGPDEMPVYRERGAKVASRGQRFLATRFAAKEAFGKALGMGIREPVTWQDLQIINDEQGKPEIKASGPLLDYMLQRSLTAQVSLSDEADYAVAFVIVEQGTR